MGPGFLLHWVRAILHVRKVLAKCLSRNYPPRLLDKLSPACLQCLAYITQSTHRHTQSHTHTHRHTQLHTHTQTHPITHTHTHTQAGQAQSVLSSLTEGECKFLDSLSFFIIPDKTKVWKIWNAYSIYIDKIHSKTHCQ